MKIHVSKGNIKLGTIPNISLPPVETCPSGVLCADKCYAFKAWRQYPATRRAWTENLQVYQHSPFRYFTQLYDWLAKHKPDFFRVHVSGDIPDVQYWAEAASLCEQFPSIKFLVFTKRFDLDFIMAPSNLSVVLSMWPGHALPTEYAATLPRAWMQDGTGRAGCPLTFCPAQAIAVSAALVGAWLRKGWMLSLTFTEEDKL